MIWFGSSSGPVSAAVKAQPQSTKSKQEEEEERSVKRKREDADSHADEKEEKWGEIKKVSKEGFQLFHHNVCLLLFL